jgi:hypothetical protein
VSLKMTVWPMATNGAIRIETIPNNVIFFMRVRLMVSAGD